MNSNNFLLRKIVFVFKDYEEHSMPKRSKLGRGSGKRGRPPSRARFHKRVDCKLLIKK